MGQTQTQTITEFLLARIAEDEEVARIALAGYEDVGIDPAPSPFNPARMLAECEAKRNVVLQCTSVSTGRDIDAASADGDAGPWMGDAILSDLASVYADHPDYRDEWR